MDFLVFISARLWSGLGSRAKSGDNDTIAVTVYNYYNNSTMGDVQIEIHRRGVTTGNDTTNLQGEATLTKVESDKKYAFI